MTDLSIGGLCFKTEDRGQRAEDRGETQTEGRGQRAEDRGEMRGLRFAKRRLARRIPKRRL